MTVRPSLSTGPGQGKAAGRPIRWPATPLAWALLAALVPLAVGAGFVYGLVAPVLWAILWLLPF